MTSNIPNINTCQLFYLNVMCVFRYGIECIGISSDGDSRLLNAMKNTMKLDLIPHIDVLNRLCAGSSMGFTCVQDTIDIGTKLRNRLLNSSVVLRMGNDAVSALHVKILINTVSKEIHGLVASDIYVEDRQNFKSLEKVMEKRVLESLEKNVADCKATVMYLKLCMQITSSYVQHDLRPIDRIYRLWSAVYFLRSWRKWIQISKKGYTLKDNFITSNAYACVELNAQALIELILKLRSAQLENMFITQYFSSQACENFFRQMRSMGTINFTKINFTIFNLLHMISLVELMNKIIFSYEEIVSPRIKPNCKTSNLATGLTMNLPSNEEILQAMMNARNDALQKSAEFGMIVTWEGIITCDVQNLNASIEETLSDDAFEEEYEYAMEADLLAEDLGSNLIEVVDMDGSSRKMKKSTFIWMISESNDKLSSDRLKRVQGSDFQQNKRFKSSTTIDNKLHLFKSENLEIGEWAIFRSNNDAIQENTSTDISLDNYLIGIVVGFRYVQEKNQVRKYKYNYAPTTGKTEENKTLDKTVDKTIQVLCIWYD